MIFITPSISPHTLPAVEELYNQTFPWYERRPWNEQLDLLQQGELQLAELRTDEAFTGFIFYWQLSGFTFIEHFAIMEAARGKGAGSKILQQLTDHFHSIVLEVEPAETSVNAERRIRFYQRAGFILFEERYMQPPYIPGNPYLPMQLMHQNVDLKKTSFETIKHDIYATVYHIQQ